MRTRCWRQGQYLTQCSPKTGYWRWDSYYFYKFKAQLYILYVNPHIVYSLWGEWLETKCLKQGLWGWGWRWCKKWKRKDWGHSYSVLFSPTLIQCRRHSTRVPEPPSQLGSDPCEPWGLSQWPLETQLQGRNLLPDIPLEALCENWLLKMSVLFLSGPPLGSVQSLEVQSEQLSFFSWTFQVPHSTNIPILQNTAFVVCVRVWTRRTLTQSWWLEGVNYIIMWIQCFFIKNNSILCWWC